MRLPLALLLVGLLGVSSPWAQTFDVVGVDPTDTLNMRADLDRAVRFSDAKIVGEIPPHAKGLKTTGVWVTLQGSKWREVSYSGITGWVSDKYLRPSGILEMPSALQCFGTEPFWGLSIDENESELNDPSLGEVQTLSLIAKRQGLNRTNLWTYYLSTEDKTSVLTSLVVYTDQCSDGMSDRSYGYEIFLMGLRPGAGPAQGCCTLAD